MNKYNADNYILGRTSVQPRGPTPFGGPLTREKQICFGK